MSDLRRFIAKIGGWPKGLKARAGAVVSIIKDAEAHYRDLKAKDDDVRSRLQDTNQKLVFGNVGLALSYWAKMEEAIVVIAALLLRVPNEKAGLMMYSILNFNSWLDIINSLFDIDDTLLPFKGRWSKVSRRIRAIKDQRDQLAHHPIEGTSTAIKASVLDIRQKTKKQSALNVDEILQFHDAVLKIIGDLVSLVEAMSAAIRDASPHKSHE